MAEPKKEEWALINNQQALEYQRLKEIEKITSKQKKDQLRMELDQQLNGKSDFTRLERD